MPVSAPLTGIFFGCMDADRVRIRTHEGAGVPGESTAGIASAWIRPGMNEAGPNPLQDIGAFLRVVDGNFMIRAETIPVPELAAGAAVLLATSLMLRRRH